MSEVPLLSCSRPVAQKGWQVCTGAVAAAVGGDDRHTIGDMMDGRGDL